MIRNRVKIWVKKNDFHSAKLSKIKRKNKKKNLNLFLLNKIYIVLHY